MHTAKSSHVPAPDERAQKSISAGIIIFRRTPEGVKFLLLYHGKGYWNFPKGRLEAGERSWQTAFREVREETGLKSTDLKLVADFKSFERFYFHYQGQKIFRVVILYLAETTKQSIVLAGDHEEGYGWFSFNDAKRMLSKHKDNLKILQKAYNYLHQRKPRPLGEVRERANPSTEQPGGAQRNPPAGRF
jgi:8-oxo-dGTP pyrophosphatase MutT (NUDIX family)